MDPISCAFNGPTLYVAATDGVYEFMVYRQDLSRSVNIAVPVCDADRRYHRMKHSTQSEAAREIAKEWGREALVLDAITRMMEG